MTAVSVSMAPIVSTAVQMQAFATAITTQLAAFGLVQTSDTGQTASSALTLGVINTPSGYQVWRFADALQSTAPVFFKIEFGAGGSASYPSIWITAGSGSDGAGNITGVTIARTQLAAPSSSTSSFTSYMSGSTDRFCLAICATGQSQSYCITLGLERTRNSDGSDSADGILFLGYANSIYHGQYGPFSGTIRAAQSTPVVPVVSGTTSLAVGSSVALVPILPMGQQGPTNAGMQWLVYYGPDLTALNAVPATVYGSSHTYMPLGTVTNGAEFTGWATSYLAMLYE